MKTSISEINNIFAKYQINTKKRFGQNFLTSANVVQKIIDQVDGKYPIIEVGPGIGALTELLVKKAKIKAYEIDLSLKTMLESEFPMVEFIFEDFLLQDLSNLDQKYDFVSNLPYYITSEIFFKLFDNYQKFNKIVLMMQKEVADRFLAKANTSAYSSLSVLAQYRFEINKVVEVSANNFIPKPKVDSTVLSFRAKNAYSVSDEMRFFNLVKLAFSMRRKTLKNNLKSIVNFDQIIKKIALNPKARAQELSLEDFIKLYEAIYQ